MRGPDLAGAASRDRERAERVPRPRRRHGHQHAADDEVGLPRDHRRAHRERRRGGKGRGARRTDGRARQLGRDPLADPARHVEEPGRREGADGPCLRGGAGRGQPDRVQCIFETIDLLLLNVIRGF